MPNLKLVPPPATEPRTAGEVLLQFGKEGRSFGILTMPAAKPASGPALPVFVLLSSGLLHRVGPGRIHVRLARELSALGFPVLRVDLFARGDSPVPSGVAFAQAASANYADLKALIAARLGPAPIVLVGLCSGADDAVRFAIDDPAVKGLVLLDPICFPDSAFKSRALLSAVRETLCHPRFRLGRLAAHAKSWLTGANQHGDDGLDPLSVRNAPPLETLQSAFAQIEGRDGRALAIFTRYAMTYYNHAGQMKAVAFPGSRSGFCTELLWPDVFHTYTLDVHRRRLIETIKDWAICNFRQERASLSNRRLRAH